MIKLGNAFNEVQLFAESILLYERALALLPDNALAHRHLGASLTLHALSYSVKFF